MDLKRILDAHTSKPTLSTIVRRHTRPVRSPRSAWTCPSCGARWRWRTVCCPAPKEVSRRGHDNAR